MPYIKLLTVLAGLALLTACGGATADKAGGDTNTGEVSTTDCTATPFDTNCDAVESAITSRQTTCFASATANRRCGVVIAGACVANPFRAETACMADTYLPARIAECIKGGEADEGKCATITTDAEKNTMITSCLKNPFDIVCKMTVADFATYTDTARMNRLDFCDNNANVANTLCTDNNVVIICGIDPFNAICFTGDTYLSPRITDCIKTENTGIAKCNTLLSDTAMNTELTDCLTNPFATACESVTAFTDFALARTNRLTFCNDSDNVANGLCTGENLMNVCVADSFNAICFAGDTYLPARVNNCITDGNAGETKCDNLFTASASNDCLTNPFTDACEADGAFGTYAGMARTKRETFCESGSGEICTALTTCQDNPFDPSCESYFESAKIPHCIEDSNGDETRCENLFTESAANNCLINPFTDACASATEFTSYLTDARMNRDTFCETNPSDAVCDTLNLCNGNPFATACEAYFQPARVNLCGGATDFATCVNVGDLPTYETKPNERTLSGLLTATATGLNTTDIQFVGFPPRTISTPLTIGRRGGAGTTDSPNTNPDGFAYFVTNSSAAFIGYAGILPTTNLGAPLAMQPANAVWAGHFSTGTTTNIAVNYFVDFTNGKFGFSNDEGNDTDGTLMNNSSTFTMDAHFGSHASANGYSAGRMGGTLVIAETGGGGEADIVGLIGAEGAVGVFVNEGERGGFIGGFTATNPN